jgi:hypothetical protein
MRLLKVGTAAWWAARTRFEPETGCVLWTGFTDPLGYARTSWKGKEGVLVHRAILHHAATRTISFSAPSWTTSATCSRRDALVRTG